MRELQELSKLAARFVSVGSQNMVSDFEQMKAKPVMGAGLVHAFDIPASCLG